MLKVNAYECLEDVPCCTLEQSIFDVVPTSSAGTGRATRNIWRYPLRAVVDSRDTYYSCYGDSIPLTLVGRVLEDMIMILGTGLVALPAGMLSPRFSDVVQQQINFLRFVGDSLNASGGITHEYAEQVETGIVH